MQQPTSHGSSDHIKLIIAGPPECGKSEFMRSLAQRYANSTLRDYKLGWLEVLRLDFPWPEPEPDRETPFMVHVHALIGKISYEALYELLLSNCHAVLMMIDMDPTRKTDGLQTMIQTADALKRIGHDIRSVPMVFQYHRAELASQELVHQWDQLLDLQQSAVPRFFSASNFAEGSFTGFEILLKETRKLLQSPQS